MKPRTKHICEALCLAFFIAGGAAYAAAQQHQPDGADAHSTCPMGDDMMMGGGMKGGMKGGMHADDQASCPMMGMRAQSDVAVEDTKTGVIIRVTAKKTEAVPRIQKLAHRMAQCMSPAETAPAAPAAPATHAH